MEKLALALGGGGVRCFTHLGVAQALKEEKIAANFYATASFGSLVGVLLANNIDIETIRKTFAKNMTRAKWLIPTISRHSMISQVNFKHILEELLDVKKIEKLETPIAIVGTDYNTGQQIIFRKGNIIDAVSASCSFPGIYNPIKYNGHLIGDGGIVNNIPADICRNYVSKKGKVISVTVTGKFDPSISKINSKRQIIYRSIYIPLEQNREKIIRGNSDLILRPNNDIKISFTTWTGILNMFSKKKMDLYYNKGYLETKKNIKKIKNCLK